MFALWELVVNCINLTPVSSLETPLTFLHPNSWLELCYNLRTLNLDQKIPSCILFWQKSKGHIKR